MTNKHLLPVGSWPMVYYPLQLLQRLGVREVLLVTGQQHAGEFIDLLGDGQRRRRAAAASCCSTSTSPTRCRSSPAGSRRWSAWRATSPRTTGSSSASATTSSSTPSARRSRTGTAARSSSSRTSPTPRTSASSPTTATARSRDIVEKAGVVDTRYERRPPATRSSASTATRPRCSRSSTTLEPSSRGELEITDVNREFARRGELQVQRVEGWWHDGGKHWRDLAEVGRLIEQTGVNK